MRKEAAPQKKAAKINRKNLSLSDKWILSRLVATSTSNLKDLSLDRLELSLPATRLYDFVWNDFADWYLEAKKIEDPAGTDNTVLSYVLENILKMLHPYIPFVTEVLWEKTGHTTLLLNERYTKFGDVYIDEVAERQFKEFQKIIAAIRSVRAELKLNPGKLLPIDWVPLSPTRRLKILVEKMGKVEILGSKMGGNNTIMRTTGPTQIFFHLDGLVDIEREITRIGDEVARSKMSRDNQLKKINNVQYRKNAPEEDKENTKRNIAKLNNAIFDLQRRLDELKTLRKG
jgi:valyl-tRNA synthetase